RKPSAGLAVQEHIAAVRPLQQPGGVQQRRLAGARRRHQCHHLAARQREVGAREDRQLALALLVVALDALEFDDEAAHSYLSASTGSSLAARHAGTSVARNDSTRAIRITDSVSEKSILAGSW